MFLRSGFQRTFLVCCYLVWKVNEFISASVINKYIAFMTTTDTSQVSGCFTDPESTRLTKVILYLAVKVCFNFLMVFCCCNFNMHLILTIEYWCFPHWCFLLYIYKWLIKKKIIWSTPVCLNKLRIFFEYKLYFFVYMFDLIRVQLRCFYESPTTPHKTNSSVMWYFLL